MSGWKAVGRFSGAPADTLETIQDWAATEGIDHHGFHLPEPVAFALCLPLEPVETMNVPTDQATAWFAILSTEVTPQLLVALTESFRVVAPPTADIVAVAFLTPPPDTSGWTSMGSVHVADDVELRLWSVDRPEPSSLTPLTSTAEGPPEDLHGREAWFRRKTGPRGR